MEHFKVVVAHNAHEDPPIITFELRVVTEDNDLPLDSRTFQHESFESATRIIEAYKLWISEPEIQIGLMSKDIGRILGFEVDFSKGINNFFKDMARHFDTESIEGLMELADYEPMLIELQNELKTRGEI